MTDDPRAVMAAFLRRRTQTDDLNMPLPEAQIATLREVQTKFSAMEKRIPFKPGDIVTVASTSPLKGGGKPHIVVEVMQAKDAHRSWEGEVGTVAYGRRNEVRIAELSREGEVRMIWVEAVELVPYEPV